MKKIGIVLLTLVIGLPLFDQGQVTTRKHRLADFTDKMTQIVLSGDEVLNAALLKEIPYIWTSSTFEFCLDRSCISICITPLNGYALNLVSGIG